MSPNVTVPTSIVPAFKSARKVSAPLVVIRTTDPSATIDTVSSALSNLYANASKGDAFHGITPPMLRWDCVNGLEPVNTAGAAALAVVLGGRPQTDTISDVEALNLLRKAPAHTAVVVLNAHRMWNQPQSTQAIWNLRDHFKTNYRTLVMLTPPASAIPTELQTDMVTLEEPLPTPADLGEVVRSIYQSVGKAADETAVSKCVEALSGVRSIFTAEQATAMCLTRTGVDVDALWAHKKQLVNDTRGLTWIDPTVTYDSIAGLETLKKFFTQLFTGNSAPTVIVFMDELNDMLAGVGTDTSGVSTMQHGKFLTHLVSTRALGSLLLGHPGLGKSAICEATAKQFGVPFIKFDLGDTKAKHVGESEEFISTALAVLDAISQGHALYIGTCNSTENLSPQLMSRFRFRFFFDLPTVAERKAIWPIYEQRPHPDAAGPLTAAQLKSRPDDTDWTGREIAYCAENAWRLNCTLRDAANYVVPIATSMPEQIDRTRREASNRILSASYPGTYRIVSDATAKIETVPIAVKLPRAISGMKES